MTEKRSVPRFARVHAPGAVHHIIARCVNGEFRFDAVPGAREEFLARFARALVGSDWTWLAYCCMGNHIHLVLIAGEQPASTFMKAALAGTAAWWHRQRRAQGGALSRSRGPFFAERFADVVIPPEAAGVCIVYVHNNPPRAGLVAGPDGSGWSSHRAYLGMEAAVDGLDVEAGLRVAGFGTTRQERARFHDFTVQRLNERRRPDLSGGMATSLRRIARAAHKLPLEISEPTAATSATSVVIVGETAVAARYRFKGSTGDVVRAVAAFASIDDAVLRSRARIAPLPALRSLAAHVWARLGGPSAKMAAELGIARPSIRYLLLRPCEPDRIERVIARLVTPG